MCLNVHWVGMSGVWWDQLALSRLWEGKLGCAAVQRLLNAALAPWRCVAALQSLFSRISLEHFLGQTLVCFCMTSSELFGLSGVISELVYLPYCLRDLPGGVLCLVVVSQG